jgi:hypothetical protein
MGLALFAALWGLLSPAQAVSIESAPNQAEVQIAYDNEASANAEAHIKGLRIVGVDCSQLAERKYSCQVGFRNDDTPEDRVFLDVATLELTENKSWKLRSGLCRKQNY